MIDLRPDFLDTLKHILAEIVPDCEVRIFGSRYRWTATDASDVDLALVGAGKLPWKTLTRLKAELEESSLPFRVDVLDWHTISPEFQKVIEQGYEVIQKPGLGVSAKGWETTSLGEIAEIIMGQSPTGETCNEVGNGVPLLNGPTEFGNFHPNPVQYTTDPKKFSELGDLLFCVRGSTTGRMNWADQQYAIGRGLAALRHKKGKNYQSFLKGIIDYYLPVLLTEATGSTFPNVSSQQLSQLSVEVPPLSIQRRISAILSALDEKIELNCQTNTTLEAIAQAIFKEWFVDFNFPGATGEMVESELGMIPRGWRVGKLGEIITNYDSKRVPLSSRERESLKGIYPYYGAASILDYIDDFLFDGIYLLMGEDGTVITDDEKPVLQYVTGKFWVNNHTHVLQGKGSFSTEFIYLLLKNTNIKHIVTGAVQPKINQGNMNNISVVIPDTEKLIAFQEVTIPVFAYILEIEQQSATLVALRDTLLPKLMGGEIDVNGVEDEL